ncbi:MAG: hypothetical protein ABJL55_06000 [Roseibium sp.]
MLAISSIGNRSITALMCLFLLGLSVIETSASEEPDALDLCVPDQAEWVAVQGPDADGLFQSVQGEIFFPTDLSGWFGSMQEVSDSYLVAENLEAAPVGPANRWGIRPAWVRLGVNDDHSLLQARVLEDGYSVFSPAKAEGQCADVLRAAERIARRAERKIWEAGRADLVYASSALKALEEAAGRHVIVRGRIVSLGKTRSTLYLNFGNYWKNDFTVTVKTAGVEALETSLASAGWHLDDLVGQAVEIRGVIQIWDGPHIELLNPEQLVVLENKRAGREGQNRK